MRWKLFFNENAEIMVSKKKIILREGWVEKTVIVMPKCDHQDRLFYPILTLMIYSSYIGQSM